MKQLLAFFPARLRYKLFSKYLFVNSLLIIIFICSSNGLYSQVPMHYNPSIQPVGNSLPFGAALAAQGYECQWLIGPGEYTLPTPAILGDITKFYIYMSTTGAGTYTNLTIRMGQTTLTALPTGSAYSGTLDTVYFRASVPLSSTASNWLMFTLDSTFPYNPAQSLVIQVSHCGITGTGMNVWQNTGTTGIFRRNPIPGTPSCVFTYTGQDSRVLQNGLDITPPVGIGSNNEVPNVYKLAQNYPNPFNPVTNIDFSLPKEGNVEIKIYNILGMEAGTILSGFKEAGNHSISFDASHLASGVYYYTMKANDFKETKKMLLIK